MTPRMTKTECPTNPPGSRKRDWRTKEVTFFAYSSLATPPLAFNEDFNPGGRRPGVGRYGRGNKPLLCSSRSWGRMNWRSGGFRGSTKLEACPRSCRGWSTDTSECSSRCQGWGGCPALVWSPARWGERQESEARSDQQLASTLPSTGASRQPPPG